MMPSPRWNWLIIPLALGLGSAVGVVVDRQILLRSSGAKDRAVEAILAKVEPPKPPAAEPPAALGPGSPFNPPFEVEPPPAPSADIPEAAPPKVEPPFSVRDGRVVFEPPPGYFDLPAPDKKDGTDPPLLKPGQLIQVEVLEALPGRPITGERVVRPDGTISLGFYGDLRVAGLNRYQIKAKLIEHLLKDIRDEVLGLVRVTPDGGMKAVPPVESSRVFVDDSLNYYPGGPEQAARPTAKVGFPDQIPTNARFIELENQLQQVIKELGQLHEERRPAGSAPSASSKASVPLPVPSQPNPFR